ncbi:hypothetical protein ACYSNU_10855 [Enterococcus sp. LJL120]
MQTFKTYLFFKRKLSRRDLTTNILLIIPFLLIVLLFFSNQTLRQREQDQLWARDQEIIKHNKQFLVDYRDSPEDVLPENQEAFNESTQKVIDELELFHNGSSTDRLAIENQWFDGYYRLSPQLSVYGPTPMELYGFEPGFYVDGRKLVNDYLLEQNIANDSIRYGTNTQTFLMSLSTYLLSIFGLVYFMLCFGFQNLKFNEANNYRFFAVQPLPRVKVFLADLLEFLIRSLLFLVLLGCFAYAIPWLFGSRSSWLFPVLMKGEFYQYHIIPVWQYLLVASGIFLLNLMLFYIISQLFFLFLRKSFVSIFLSLALFAYLLFASQLTLPAQLRPLAAYSPSTYVSASDIFFSNSNEEPILVEGGYSTDPLAPNYEHDYYSFDAENIGYYSNFSLARRTSNPDISWQKGLLSLTIFNGVMLIVCGQIYKRKMCS